MTRPSIKEDHISQIPALQLLQNLGYQYLTPTEALELRGGRESAVILEKILIDWMHVNNVIRFKGKETPFSEANILDAVRSLKEVEQDGLIRTSEKIYDLLCLGRSLPQSIDGDIKSFPLHFINWEHPEENIYHVSEEFSVARTGSKECYRPDIVLFVNGIPFVVIECKRPSLGPGKDPIKQAISQHLRNQREDGIPHLYHYAQLLLSISKNEAKYATVGTPTKFWAVWKEQQDDENELAELVNTTLVKEKKDDLFSTRPEEVREHFDAYEAAGERRFTTQDQAIYSLCRPQRLIEIAFRYILFDAGEKKIARYQQYFTVKNLLRRIKGKDRDGLRQGGVVWHTQGSGKSLTMVLLAKGIALDTDIDDYKIVLVTDRVDLDDQIYRTFHHCGLEVEQAASGKDLIAKLSSPRHLIVTTIIDKFDAAVDRKDARFDSSDIFVLVDEGHRSHYGPRHARLRQVLPKACLIGFTGTPLMKKEKNTAAKFGGIILPTYTIRQAVDDQAVVPLLYEGRHVEQMVQKEPIDTWFERITAKLTKEQAADLKKKFATTGQLGKAKQRLMRIAWDVSEHFVNTWQGTGFKGQLVAADKATAISYKEFFDEFGLVSTAVLISASDDREGNEDAFEESSDEVKKFWDAMMAKYGSPIEYQNQLINSFKYGEEPEIIIVVHKLLTGFDAPRNTVLYLTREIKEHSLLQAIARVNRLCEGKDYGHIIDYQGILENLDDALDLYAALDKNFDPQDLEGTMTDVSEVIKGLPQKHSELWDVFKQVPNKYDEEAYELHLYDQSRRIIFYERFSAFSRMLGIAFSTHTFTQQVSVDTIERYRKDLKFFKELRASVRQRYAETVDYSEYEPRIRKLIDTHVAAGEVSIVTPAVNIFDQDAFAEEVSRVTGDAAKADTIAHRTKRTLDEQWKDIDPAFFRKFSEMLEEVIRAFHEQRIKAAEYLQRATEIMQSVATRSGDDTPTDLQHKPTAKAYFGIILEVFRKYLGELPECKEMATEIAITLDEVILELRTVDWTKNSDRINEMRTHIEDYLFDYKELKGIELDFDAIDDLMEQCIQLAKRLVP
jgi:type I restriction enzyme R subunit